jgi:hypothetical protein
MRYVIWTIIQLLVQYHRKECVVLSKITDIVSSTRWRFEEAAVIAVVVR